jgi:hypothetical protein
MSSGRKLKIAAVGALFLHVFQERTSGASVLQLSHKVKNRTL